MKLEPKIGPKLPQYVFYLRITMYNISMSRPITNTGCSWHCEHVSQLHISAFFGDCFHRRNTAAYGFTKESPRCT